MYKVSNTGSNSVEEDSFQLKTIFPLPLILLSSGLIYIAYLIIHSFPNSSLFRPQDLKFGTFEEKGLVYISFLWYLLLIIGIYTFINTFNTRFFFVNNDSQYFNIKTKLRGVIIHESFDQISKIRFHHVYSNGTEGNKKIEVRLFLTDNSQYDLINGGIKTYRQFKEFLSKYPKLNDLVEIIED